MRKFDLREDADPQHYGIGIKEVWEIEPERHEEGLVVHTTGWPLDNRTEGGGFLYHAANNKVYLGLIIALNYRNPHLSTFDEFQRWKTAPEDSAISRGWQASWLRCPSREQRWFAVIAQTRVSGRHAGRLRRRISERCEDQGSAHCDQDRHAGGGEYPQGVVIGRCRVSRNSVTTKTASTHPGSTRNCTGAAISARVCTSWACSWGLSLRSSIRIFSSASCRSPGATRIRIMSRWTRRPRRSRSITLNRMA